MARQPSDEDTRARLAAFLQFAPEAIFVKNLHGCYVEASKSFLALGAWERADIVGKTDFEIFPTQMAEKFTAEDHEVRSNNAPILFEETFEYGGQIVSFLTQKFPLPNGEVAGIATDITTRKRNDAEFESVADRLRVAIEGTGIGSYEINLTTGEGIWSEAAFEMLGVAPPADLKGTSELWRSSIHPEDFDRIIEEHGRAATRGGPWQGEYRIVRADDGQVRWLFAYGRFVEREGDIYSTGIAFDVTDRKLSEVALAESEARLRALTDNLPGGMVYQVSTGKDGSQRKFLYVSQSVEKISGYKAEEILADPMVAYGTILPKHRDRVAAAEEEAVRNLAPFDCEAEFRRRDGTIGWCRIISAPRPQDDGSLIWDGIQVDITSRKLAEQQLRDLNATLEQRVAERAAELAKAEEALRQAQKLESMGQLTGGVAHDFNNLLSPIIGGLDMLQRRGIGEERTQRTIEGALASAERAKTLVQRLLAFARRQPLQPRPVDVAELISSISSLLESTLGPRISLNLDIATDLPFAVADPNQLEMALLNLTLNARDAMNGEGTLTVSVHSAAAGSSIIICVSDSGCGMDEDTRLRAIEPFFSTKGIGQGTGLGLSMVHGLALQLGGSLDLRSAPGEGTSVELCLPATERTAPVAGVERTPASHAPSGTALLVDDEELVRTSTSEMLADLGFTVTEASSAEQALDLLRAGQPPSILVTDHLMPGMTGSALIEAARAIAPDLRTLLISGYADADGIPPSIPRLSKPFRLSDLETAVDTVMQRG